MNYIKFLGLVLLGVLFVNTAKAQTIRSLDRDMKTLKEEVEVIQRGLHRGVSDDKDNAGDMVVKFGEMEELFGVSTGKIDEMEHKLRILEEKMDMINKDFEIRFAMIESSAPKHLAAQEIIGLNVKPVEVNSKPLEKNVEETYKVGLGLINTGQHDGAITIFNKILTESPKHQLAANAQYWLGEAYYAKKDFERAAVAFAKGYEQYKASPKASDSLLKLGMSMVAINKTDEACIAFKTLPIEFPQAIDSVKQKSQVEFKRNLCK